MTVPSFRLAPIAKGLPAPVLAYVGLHGPAEAVAVLAAHQTGPLTPQELLERFGVEPKVEKEKERAVAILTGSVWLLASRFIERDSETPALFSPKAG